MDLKITITGRAGSGKTAAAQQIALLLENLGAVFTMDHGVDGPAPMRPILALAGKTIHIEQVMAHRDDVELTGVPPAVKGKYEEMG